MGVGTRRERIGSKMSPCVIAERLSELFWFTPEQVLMDLWPAGDIAWGRMDIQGDEFVELAESSYAWACEQIL